MTLTSKAKYKIFAMLLLQLSGLQALFCMSGQFLTRHAEAWSGLVVGGIGHFLSGHIGPFELLLALRTPGLGDFFRPQHLPQCLDMALASPLGS